MTHEFKIVMSGPNTSNVKVFLDDQVIGLIQDIKFLASTTFDTPIIEIVFPDLFSLQHKSPLTKSLQENIIKIILKPIVFDE